MRITNEIVLNLKRHLSLYFIFMCGSNNLKSLLYHIKVTGWAYLRSAICLSALKLSANRRHFIVAAIKSLKSV